MGALLLLITLLGSGPVFAQPDSYQKGVALFEQGFRLMDHDPDSARICFKKAEQLLAAFDRREAYQFRSRLWNNLGILEQKANHNQEFVRILLHKSIPLAMKAGDSARVAKGYINVGIPFMNFGQYDKALLYFNKAIAWFRALNSRDPGLADAYVNAAKASLMSSHTAAAGPLLDSAWVILKPLPGSVYHTYYDCIRAMWYTANRQWAQAEQCLNQGLALARSLQSDYDVAMLQFGQVDLYTEQHDLPKLKNALLALYKGLYKPLDPDRQQLMLDLATTEAGLGEHRSAYDWLWKYTQLTDSLNKQQIQVKMADLEARYNFSAKEREVLLLKNKTQQQGLWLVLLLFLLILGAGFFWFWYKQRKVAGEREVMQALLAGEERERTRLARDLHDGLGGLLASVKMKLSQRMKAGDTPLRETMDHLDESVSELRRIARNLMPGTLLRSGLPVALNDLCGAFSSPELQVELSLLNVSADIPMQSQIIIYRIVQELLANVVKHAQATGVFVQCSQDDGRFFLTVEDNGKGMDLKGRAEMKGGIGLDNVRHRVEFLQGQMDVKSEPGRGTNINIELICKN